MKPAQKNKDNLDEFLNNILDAKKKYLIEGIEYKKKILNLKEQSKTKKNK